jgi:hypothetical protein
LYCIEKKKNAHTIEKEQNDAPSAYTWGAKIEKKE